MVAIHHSARTRPARPAKDRGISGMTARQEALHDAALVNRFKGGDEGAFDEIIARYRERMYSVAFSVVRNRADAEEIAQDTFIRAYRGLDGFRGDSALVTWLHRIALNLSRNRYWHSFSRQRFATSSFDSAFSDDSPATYASMVASNAPSPAQEAEIGEISELVAACMENLGPNRRDILTQRSVLDRSYNEIALKLGISLGTVKSRIARARKTLRSQIAKACPDFPSDSPPGEWLRPAWTSSRLEAVCRPVAIRSFQPTQGPGGAD
jgi:RNA polymerase sigma-70 factor (ECF subfamily)